MLQKLNNLPVTAKICLTLLVIAICMAPVMFLIRRGINVFDEPYQMLLGLFPESAPYSPLSAWLTGKWGELVNWRWLYFRYIAVGVHVTSIMIVSLWYLSKTRRFDIFLGILSIAILIATSIPNIQNIYGWDTWTLLSITLIVVISLLFIEKPNFVKLVFLSLLSATATLCRIPNIVIFIPVLLVICCTFYKKENETLTKTVYYSCYILFTSLFIYAGIISLYGNIGNYINSFSTNPIGQHSVTLILRSTFIGFCYIIFFVLAWWIFFKGLKFTDKKRTLRKIYIPLVFIIVFLYLTTCDNIWYMVRIYFPFSLLLLAIGYFICRQSKKTDKKKILIIIAVLLLCVVSNSGSNTAFTKTMTWCLFPVVVYFILPFITKRQIRFTFVILCSLLLSTYFSARNTGFHDKGYMFCTSYIETGVMKGLYCTPERKKELDEIKEKMEPYTNGKYNIMVQRLGSNYLWEYVFKTRNNFLGNRFDYNDNHFDENYIEWAENEIINSDKPVVLLYQKHNNFEETDIPDLPMLQMVQKYLDRVGDTDRYIIYATPKQNIETINNN